ncbi:hypothetical protein K466DRAFT_493082 [Polyporus arcularius HHB13444]|uniref:Tc1-like transposase DDE domain-containing protein n=1 Tax=Polyporus arcularius HHB13444 TaxID=1314778 RepID=A0A5C3PAE6_9APHY|nr:hypothetical protein K466DRAFT_493082 [Polyporus arcularius HHB13444]
MNIIEHVWDELNHCVRCHNPLPRNLNQLWATLQEEWYRLGKDFIAKLYHSLPDCI